MNKLPFCVDCQLGKAYKLPFPKSAYEAVAPLELIHSDIWGPSPVYSKDNFRYYVHFIDNHTRFTWIFTLRAKSEVK